VVDPTHSVHATMLGGVISRGRRHIAGRRVWNTLCRRTAGLVL